MGFLRRPECWCQLLLFRSSFRLLLFPLPSSLSFSCSKIKWKKEKEKTNERKNERKRERKRASSSSMHFSLWRSSGTVTNPLGEHRRRHRLHLLACLISFYTHVQTSILFLWSFTLKRGIFFSLSLSLLSIHFLRPFSPLPICRYPCNVQICNTYEPAGCQLRGR